MKIQRASCNASNFRKGRPLNFRAEAIVLHTAMGSLNGLRTQLNDPNSSTSTHYAVDKNGDVLQFLDETDTAFHAGRVEQPDWKLVREGTNPNFYTIGVSFSGSPAEEWTKEQYQAGATLVSEIAERWGIPLDADHVIAHRRIRSTAVCPGDKADVGRLISESTAASPAPSVVVRAAQVRTVGTANLRSGAPSTSAPLAGKLPAGTIVNTAGIVPGEKVQGNFNWYLDGRGNFLWAGATDQPQPGTAHSVSTDELELSRGGVETVVSSIPIDRKKFALPRSQFNDDVTTKDLIVLHFTAGGSAKSAFSAWTSNAVAVATAYLVDVDGQIYETFDPSRWAFHLGIKATHKHDRRSIGIEIANVGPLKLSPQDPNVLNWWPPEEKFLTKFCGIIDTDKYVKQRYRNFDFYAAFPEAQVESVVQLVHQLCDRFNITRAIPPQQKRAEFDMAFFDDFKGIATHSNFRSDKSDIGPAFDWSRLGM